MPTACWTDARLIVRIDLQGMVMHVATLQFAFALILTSIVTMASVMAEGPGVKHPAADLTVEERISYVQRTTTDVDRFLGFGFNALWVVVPPNLLRLDPASNHLTEIALEEAMAPGYVAVGEGAVWVTDIASDLIF